MLPDAVGVVRKMQKVAVEAMEQAKPVNVYFGRVISVSPLQISVEQKLILGMAQLILTRNVTDFKTAVTGSGENIPENGAAETGGEVVSKEITVHNALKKGDEVILFRQQGGQKYIVWDRIGVM